MKKIRLRSLLAFLFAFAMIAAACGSDGEGAASDDGGSSDDSSSSDDSGSSDDGSGDDGSGDGGAGLEGTLRVLIHQNPAGVEFFESFNSEFEEANPGATVDLQVISADDIATQNQTRLTAEAIDVTTISINGFDKAVQPYMTGADTPYWQQLIEAGLLADLSGQSYLDNYDDAAIESTSFDGGVYGVPLG
ncbi:MAG: hypothetical protein KJN63_03015, partial [Acidimicrobiia bacterium]|nr:hypothetical protein [Acidimicrobiia bacterium]